MFRQTFETRRRQAETEIHPDIYKAREAHIRNNAIKEGLAMIGVAAIAVFLFGLWLAYEGWITPASFRGIL